RPKSQSEPSTAVFVALDPPRVTATTPGIAASCAARCSMTGVFPAGPGRGRPLATGSTDPAARRAGRAVPDAASAHRGREPEDRERPAPNVVISLIRPPSTRSTSILNGRYTEAPGRRR